MMNRIIRSGLFFRYKAICIVPSRCFGSSNFGNVANTKWLTTTTDKRIGIRLTFPNTHTCQECMDYLASDVNVTVLSQDPKSRQFIIFPNKSAAETIQEILTDLKENENENYTLLRRGHLKNRSKVIVEFGSPNIAKPLHMGHLRSTVLGNFIVRIQKALNNDVYSLCFLGDWGTQFGLLHAGLNRWYQGKSILESLNEMSLTDLLEYYVRAVKEQETNPEFAKEARDYSSSLEKGEVIAEDVWKSIREKSVNHLNSVWKELDVTFDAIHGESNYTMKSPHMEKALKHLEESKVIETDSDDCKFANVKLGKMGTTEAKAKLIKSDGTSLYILRDIAAAIHRQTEHKFDRMIYVVDSAQGVHFQSLFDILRQIGVNKVTEKGSQPMLQHISFGRVKGQSTRSGTFSLLSEVIQDGQELMQTSRAEHANSRLVEDSEISKTLAISSLIINYSKVRRSRELDFDWVEALKTQGDTGVTVQYCHARLCSLINKQGSEFMDERGEMKYKVDYEYILGDPIAIDLLLHLANFEDALWTSYEDLEPCALTRHLFLLRDKCSKAIKALSVKNEEDKSIAATRFLLFLLSKNIMAYGLSILGIKPLDSM